MEPMLQESSLVKVFSIVLVNMMYFVEFNNDHQGIAYDAKLMIFEEVMGKHIFHGIFKIITILSCTNGNTLIFVVMITM